MPADSTCEGADAEIIVHGYRHIPGQYKAAVPVHNRRQIHKSAAHPNVGDIGTPHLIRMVDIQSFEQVRVLLACRASLAGIGMGGDGAEVDIESRLSWIKAKA